MSSMKKFWNSKRLPKREDPPRINKSRIIWLTGSERKCPHKANWILQKKNLMKCTCLSLKKTNQEISQRTITSEFSRNMTYWRFPLPTETVLQKQSGSSLTKRTSHNLSVKKKMNLVTLSWWMSMKSMKNQIWILPQSSKVNSTCNMNVPGTQNKWIQKVPSLPIKILLDGSRSPDLVRWKTQRRRKKLKSGWKNQWKWRTFSTMILIWKELTINGTKWAYQMSYLRR